MTDNPIKVSVSLSYKFQPRKYESMECAVHLSQVPVTASDDDINDATLQAHKLLSKGLNEIFSQAENAIQMANDLPRKGE